MALGSAVAVNGAATTVTPNAPSLTSSRKRIRTFFIYCESTKRANISVCCSVLFVAQFLNNSVECRVVSWKQFPLEEIINTSSFIRNRKIFLRKITVKIKKNSNKNSLQAKPNEVRFLKFLVVLLSYLFFNPICSAFQRKWTLQLFLEHQRRLWRHDMSPIICVSPKKCPLLHITSSCHLHEPPTSSFLIWLS